MLVESLFALFLFSAVMMKPFSGKRHQAPIGRRFSMGLDHVLGNIRETWTFQRLAGRLEKATVPVYNAFQSFSGRALMLICVQKIKKILYAYLKLTSPF